MKRKASATTGTQQATFNVPGISLSSVVFVTLSKAVDGAKEPIPRVSKKFTKNPIILVITKLRNIFVSFKISSLCFIKSCINTTKKANVKSPKTISKIIVVFMSTFPLVNHFSPTTL